MNDGSKDGTADAAEELGAIVLRQENAGPAKARNLGAKESTGEILFLLTQIVFLKKIGYLK